jgi:hypothetical protein
MSEIETLLSVDAGRLPPSTVVFFARDPEAPNRRMLAAMAIMGATLAVGAAWMGVDRAMVALLALTTAALSVWATPTAPDPEDVPIKRPTMVVTPHAIIVRDDDGLRTWRFEELKEVRSFLHEHRLGILLVRRDGSRDFLDHMSFERGERLRELIAPRLQAQRA